MKLNENEKQQISREIESLEESSSAELVAVITKQSSSYRFEALGISVFITILISLISLIFEPHAIKLFQIQVITFISLFLILEKFNKILLSLLSKSYKYTKASNYADKQFNSLGLQTTKTKQAIIFFVSYDEKFVKIITDIKIKEKIDDSYWQNIVNEFIKDIKNDQIASGYLKAIKSCNSILIKKFPIKNNDINELSNEVVEL